VSRRRCIRWWKLIPKPVGLEHGFGGKLILRQRLHGGKQVAHLPLRDIPRDEHDAAGAICIGPILQLDRRPATLRMPFTRSKSGPRSAINVSMAREKLGHSIG
jgi:hypothetical protein